MLFFFHSIISCTDEHSLSEDPEQPTNEKAFNANKKVPPYNDPFLYGSNMGYKNGNWRGQDVADILVGNVTKKIEGIGVNSLRPALYENLAEKYGYETWVDAFKHYKNIGTINNAK